MNIVKAYRAQIRELTNDKLYSSHSIAEQIGVTSLDRQMIRVTLDRLSRLEQFPSDGDGSIILLKQFPIPAWFGWRWKQATDRFDDR